MQHTKLKHLTELVGCRFVAIGILESLWHYASREAPRGDIGRKPNAYIAKGMEWKGDADQLMGWLVESGFVDRCDTHRLVIHDWQDHADDSVKKTIHRNKWSWATPKTGSCPEMSRHVATNPDMSGKVSPALALPKPEPEPLPEPSPLPPAVAGGARAADDVADDEPFDTIALPGRGRPPEPSALPEGVLGALTDWKGSQVNVASADASALAKIRVLCNGPPIGDVPVRDIILRLIRHCAGTQWKSGRYVGVVLENTLNEWRVGGIPDDKPQVVKSFVQRRSDEQAARIKAKYGVG